MAMMESSNWQKWGVHSHAATCIVGCSTSYTWSCEIVCNIPGIGTGQCQLSICLQLISIHVIMW
jgi:hypothetical protein